MNEYQVHMNQEFLMHHGVPGQVHGKRRYQNYDGSLTPLGREHYGVGQRVKDSFHAHKANRLMDENWYRTNRSEAYKDTKNPIKKRVRDVDQKYIDKNKKKIDEAVSKLSDRMVTMEDLRSFNSGNTLYLFKGDRYVNKDSRKYKNYQKQQKRDAEENARLNAAELLRYGEGKKSRQMASKEIAKMSDKALKKERDSWLKAAEYHKKNGDMETSREFSKNAKLYDKEMNKRSGADFDGTSKKKAPPKSERVDLIRKATMEANGGKPYDTVHDYAEAYEREGKRLNDEWKKMKNY